MKKNAGDILLEMGETFKERNKMYKNNFFNVGSILDELFPSGLSLNSGEDFTRFQMILMVVGKLTRYAANWEQGGHQDSIHDLAVYAAMLESIDAHYKDLDTMDDAIDKDIDAYEDKMFESKLKERYGLEAHQLDKLSTAFLGIDYGQFHETGKCAPEKVTRAFLSALKETRNTFKNFEKAHQRVNESFNTSK